jgi:hypothetical protein
MIFVKEVKYYGALHQLHYFLIHFYKYSAALLLFIKPKKSTAP